MVLMSKTSRLPERPKPPSWSQVSEDVAGCDTTDPVLQLGRDYLLVIDPVHIEKTSNASIHQITLEGDNPTQDTADVDSEKVKASNAEVQKIIDLYKELTDSVDILQDESKCLKHLQGDLSESATELRALVESISVEVSTKIGSPAGDKGSSRGKPRQKKKK